jgi:carboxyl-terminal processing protease
METYNIEHRTQNTEHQFKSKKIKKIIILLLIIFWLGAFFASGFVVGKLTDGKIAFKGDLELYKPSYLPALFESSLLQQIWTIIQTEYVDQEGIDETKLYYGALRGFVAGLEDPHSTFLDPDTTKAFEEQIAGEFEGIGAEISLKDGILTVVAPLPESPAEIAGLRTGDKVYSVDGVETIGKTLEELVTMIRGKKGTAVTLLIVRGDEDPQDIEITRDVIELKSVRWEFRDDGLAHLELRAFNGDTIKLINQFVNEYKNSGSEGILFDMRNNPGGLLDVAIDICSLWVGDDVVVLEKFGDGREIKYTAGKVTPLADVPTVILINEGSASGSEIVAGAFQDLKIADVVGKKSFGKGSVQALKKLPEGSSVKITVAKWLTPKGRSISEEGIEPDYEVEYTREDAEAELDPQLDKAIELLK